MKLHVLDFVLYRLRNFHFQFLLGLLSFSPCHPQFPHITRHLYLYLMHLMSRGHDHGTALVVHQGKNETASRGGTLRRIFQPAMPVTCELLVDQWGLAALETRPMECIRIPRISFHLSINGVYD